MKGKTANKIVIEMKHLDGHPKRIESSRSASGVAAILEPKAILLFARRA
jgi:hypothetical protein